MSTPRPFMIVLSQNAKVIHLIDPTTRESYCKTENNIESAWVRGCGYTKMVTKKFSVRSRYGLPDCQNCVTAKARTQKEPRNV